MMCLYTNVKPILRELSTRAERSMNAERTRRTEAVVASATMTIITLLQDV